MCYKHRLVRYLHVPSIHILETSVRMLEHLHLDYRYLQGDKDVY